MGFWGDVAGVLTGGYANYHTANALGMADSGIVKVQAKSNPAAYQSYEKQLAEDKDKDDMGMSESKGMLTGGTAGYKIGKAFGMEDSGFYKTIQSTNPAAKESYDALAMIDKEKAEEKELQRSMQIGAYTPPDLTNPDGLYHLGRK